MTKGDGVVTSIASRTKRRSGVFETSGDPTRPIIKMHADVHDVIAKASEALGGNPDVYQRDGELVHIVFAPEIVGSPTKGAPTIRALHLATIREMLTRMAIFHRFDKKSEEWVHSVPNDGVVSGVARRSLWPAVRPLIGLLEAPALRSDGSILQEPGYDAATGYVLTPAEVFPPVEDAPTREDARWAYAALCEVIADFPFENQELGRSVFVAALLTILARPAIFGAIPGFHVDANVRGSGKTLIADVISIIATGRAASRMTFTLDPAEQEKTLGAFALRGAPMINFDNVTVLGGDALNKVMTTYEHVDLRVLGKSEIASVPWRTVILSSGNNVEFLGDTTRRFVLLKLESPLEQPEERSDYRIGDLRTHVREHRAELAVYALTILRAWFVAGRPGANEETWGSFEAWSHMIPPAIVFAGGVSPMKARVEGEGRESTERAALSALLTGWPRLDPDGKGVTMRDAVRRLFPERREAGPPDGLDDLRDAIEALCPGRSGKPPSTKELGNALRKQAKRWVGGRRLETRPGRAGAVRWTVGMVGHGESGESIPTLRVESRQPNQGELIGSDSPDSPPPPNNDPWGLS